MATPNILVRHYMKPATHFFSPSTTVQEVVKDLLRFGISGGPVIDESHQLQGYVTEQDCIKQMLNGSYYGENHTIASDIMRNSPLVISPEDDIMQIAEMMLNKKPKQYPVVKNGKVIGVLTRSDVLRALSQHPQKGNSGK